MCHVAHQQGSTLVSNAPESSEVPIPRISTSSRDNHLGAEVHRLLLQLVVIDEPGVIVDLVRQTFKVDGGSRNLLSVGCVISVRQMAT